MPIKKKTVFTTSDGLEFTTITEAKDHEKVESRMKDLRTFFGQKFKFSKSDEAETLEEYITRNVSALDNDKLVQTFVKLITNVEAGGYPNPPTKKTTRKKTAKHKSPVPEVDKKTPPVPVKPKPKPKPKTADTDKSAIPKVSEKPPASPVDPVDPETPPAPPGV
jgi:hypothetical protein